MKKIGKAYEVELRGEEAKSRSKAIKYIELNMSNAKDQLQKEMSHLFAQLQASNNTIG